MEFYDTLDQVMHLLRSRGRVSYRALRLQAHCHLGLGILYATAAQRQQTHAELSTAITLYRAMDMIFWLPQAEAVLA
jgi:hypothetical protein